MLFLQRIKDIFNLNQPMGRLRYLFTYVIISIIICPILFVLAPSLIMYSGEETLFEAILAGAFDGFEVFFYLILSFGFCYAIEFCLDAKRLLDIIEDKKTAIIISTVITLIGIASEFFIPLNNENVAVSNLYLFFALGLFGFLCIKKGSLAKSSEDAEATTEDNESVDPIDERIHQEL